MHALPNPDRRHHWRAVADEFERRCTNATSDAGNARDPMRVIKEMALLNQQLRLKYKYDLTSVIPSQDNMRAMLAAFYQRVAPDRQHIWVKVAGEFMQRVDAGGAEGIDWHAEAVLLEFIQLNQELRLKYGQNLSYVADQWLPDHKEVLANDSTFWSTLACLLFALGIVLVCMSWLYNSYMVVRCDPCEVENADFGASFRRVSYFHVMCDSCASGAT